MRMLPCLGQIPASCTLLGATLLFAQAQQPVALDRTLSQIEVNTELYNVTVPSFICDEHIVSQEVHEGKIKRKVVVDAVFSVTRSTVKANTLEESREVKLVDGKPALSKSITMPLSFSGGFSGALNKFLSSDHRLCFEYAADASTPYPQGIAAFTFVANPTTASQPDCASIQPGTTGRFTVDIASMQVTHIQRTVQNPVNVNKDRTVLGTAAVDYAPVVLNGKSFWLPTTITAFTKETSKTNGVRFTAHYSKYHRFEATVAIVPEGK
jgi:hypothetical protein